MNVKPLVVCLAVSCCGSVSLAQFNSRPRTAAEQLNQQWSRGRAEGKGPVKVTNFPLRAEDISHINPMGMMASGHTTPTDHLYLVAKETPDKDEFKRGQDYILHRRGQADRLPPCRAPKELHLGEWFSTR